MNRLTKILLLIWLVFSGCQSEKKTPLTIATAANMQFAMKKLTADFTKQTGIACNLTVSSSGKLTAQIREGAPYDLFVSADLKYPRAIYEEGLALDTPKTYARGRLVLWTLGESEPSVDMLSRPEVHHIALANPKTAPYGVAAMQVLNNYQLADELNDKLVFGESISQTNQFILSGSAEMGFTAMSVVLSDEMKGKGKFTEIGVEYYTPIEQAMVMIKHPDKDSEAVKQFYDFMSSDAAHNILVDFGYRLP